MGWGHLPSTLRGGKVAESIPGNEFGLMIEVTLHIQKWTDASQPFASQTGTISTEIPPLVTFFF